MLVAVRVTDSKCLLFPCVVVRVALLQALEVLEVVLQEGATCVALDFTGSGLSQGDWVTLGFNEKDDVNSVIEHLRATETVSTIALWGRRCVYHTASSLPTKA